MVDDRAMLQAVLDAPDDDAPRLAYAAWSEAQGEELGVARGELIRAQIELERMEQEDAPAGELFRIRYRIDQLITRHGREWAQPLPDWVESFSFLRGFVGWVKLEAPQFLQYAERIFALAPVQHVDLTGVRDVDERLFESKLLAHIRTLAMDRCGLHDVHVQLLAVSPYVQNLRWLSLADNELTLAAAEAIAASEHLRKLRFAEFRGNPADPGERLGYDGGVLVASVMPPEADALEARFGHLAWLHRDVESSRWDRYLTEG